MLNIHKQCNRHISGSKQDGKNRQSSIPSSPVVEEAGPRRHFNFPSISRNGGEDYGREVETVGAAGLHVIARISVHSLRDERMYNICKTLVSKLDPNGNHIVPPVAIMRLESRPEDEGPLVVCIFEDAGPNYLPQVVDYGPAWYQLDIRGNNLYRIQSETFVAQSMSLQTFLDFAIGAAECLELLHGQQIVHGEIRGDAFHMNKDTGRVRLINIGAGLRTFEHGLTSSGWSTMSEEHGAKTKLSYMSPEQTGRMSIEPDSRTDIFSLGVLFWTILMSRPAFQGETPMDILQAVLGQRLPLVSNTRLDIPEVIGRIIQKMTAKTIFERYHSASGLRHDLVEIQRLLSTGDSAPLLNWEIATKDVSPYFILPKLLVGRTVEHDAIVKILEDAFRQYRSGQRQEKSSTSHLSRLSEGRFATFGSEDISFDDDHASSSDGSKKFPTLPGEALGHHTVNKANSSKMRSPSNSHRNSIDSSGTGFQESDPRLPENRLSTASDSVVAESRLSANSGPRSSSDSIESAVGHRKYGSFSAKGQCEIITIAGAAGLGKTRLIQSLQIRVRQRGYFASSSFQQTERTPLVPVLKLLSSLFQQFFSESDMDPGFHQVLKRHVAPVWPILHKVLDLPESLISSRLPIRVRSQSRKPPKGYNRIVEFDTGRRDSTSSSSQSSLHNKTMGAQSSQDFLRAGSSTKSLPSINIFLDILRLFASHKCICLCLEDLHFADEESLDLIAQIVSMEINVVVILSYRTEASSSNGLKAVLETLMKEGKTSAQQKNESSLLTCICVLDNTDLV
jgi:serine/threonine protein kinase